VQLFAKVNLPWKFHVANFPAIAAAVHSASVLSSRIVSQSRICEDMREYRFL
jgi:hypothetical protein